MPKTMSRLSVDDLIVPVQVLVPEGANSDTTTDVVRFAFTVGRPPTDQQPGTWYVGGWLRDLGQILATITVGPGTSVPAFKPGTYTVWIMVSDDPTSPVAAVDYVTFY